MHRATALAVLLLAPPALAQAGPGHGERVDVVGAEFPPVVLAERPFYINVTVQNRGSAEERITLFATLYEGTSATPCEGARAVHSLSKFQKSATLQPGQQLRVEGEPEHWAQVVNGSRVPVAGTYEVCVWARQAQCPQGADLAACFLDYFPLQQAVRLRNAAPDPGASVDPPRGTTATRFSFAAQPRDADGDAVQVTWDFGDGTPLVRAARVAHTFDRAGTYTVIANATDGLDFALATLRVEVAPAPAGRENGAPGFEAALLALALLTAARRRGPRRR